MKRTTMRGRTLRLLGMVAAGVTAAGATAAGCAFDFTDDCSVNMNLACFYAGTTGTGGTGGTTTVPAECVPSKNNAAVENTCGVFVSSSQGDDDKADGTKEKPYATFAKAMEAKPGKPLYACGESFDEHVTLAADVHVYGALDCVADWVYSSEKRTTIAPSTEGVAVQVTSKAAVQIEDVNITAAAASTAGGSSIAVLAESETDVALTRSDVTSGAAKDGADGEPFAMDGTPGLQGSPGGEACSDAPVSGGSGPQSECGEVDSIGGGGGNGDLLVGGSGSPGTPFSKMNGGNGQFDDLTLCTAGMAGDDGAAGTSAEGAKTTGTIDAKGYSAPAADAGEPGKTAQGGGGGGGAKGGNGDGKNGAKKECGTVMGFGSGASGGSGGSGGCGGAGGHGGKAGGASIGILSLGATFTFLNVTITAGTGGNGGAGGLGQNGGDGGIGGKAGTVPAPATDLKPACAGGPGGKGGAGGRGGGGLGGPSIGIAHTGAAPNIEGAAVTPGMPGEGGEGDGATGKGAVGIAAAVQNF